MLYGLGAAGGQQGDELAAMIYLRLALYLTPQNSLAIITLGDIYERIKQNEQAIDVYDMVREDDPLRTTADIQTGQILEALGRPDEAAKYLKQIVDENPKNEDALSALGNLQRAHKHYAEAIETYSRALAETGKPEKADWPIYYFRGISYEREKKWPEAEADLLQALALVSRSAHGPQLSWLQLGRSEHEPRRSLHHAAPRGRIAADRRLYRR